MIDSMLLTRTVPQLRSRLGAAIFHKVAGDSGPKARDRIHGTPGPRWFPPGSPIQQVHGDASMFVGGMRALMLQSLHPAAGWARRQCEPLTVVRAERVGREVTKDDDHGGTRDLTAWVALVRVVRD